MKKQNLPVSKNFVDRSAEGKFGGQIRAQLDPESLPYDLEYTDGPGDYGKYLNEMLRTMKPEDWQAMRSGGGYSFEDLMFIRALKKYGINRLTDPKFRGLFYRK